MAKYDWKSLEKEYILSNYKSVSAFLKNKNIPNNGSTRNKTKGWKDKKQDKQDKINTRTVQKVIMSYPLPLQLQLVQHYQS